MKCSAISDITVTYFIIIFSFENTFPYTWDGKTITSNTCLFPKPID